MKLNAETMAAIAVFGDGGGGGYPEPTGTVTITENGTVNVKSYASAAVNVPNSYTVSDEGKVVSNGALVAQTSTTKTANGTYDTTENDEVVVNVEPNLQTKTATENGTVRPDLGYDGLSSVVVNVQGGGGLGPPINYYGVNFSNTTTADTGDATTGWIYSILESPTTPSGEEQVICSKAPVDLTNISSIYFMWAYLDFDTNWSNKLQIGVSQAAPTSADNAVSIAATRMVPTKNYIGRRVDTEYSAFDTLDVSNLSGPHYVWLASKLLYASNGRFNTKCFLAFR